MCGLAGWIGHLPAGDDTAPAMAAAIRHRGPDGTGIKDFEGACLVHTRLRIIDLSPLADQPMCNEDGTVWVVYNGEIYNHHELRRDLERRGHRFRSATDTEVLVHLFEDEGAEMLGRLRGMFAFAILDTRARTLLVARDRFGIKPMYVAPAGDALAFASEIPALRLVPGVDLTPDRQAIADYMGLSHVPPPATLFEGVEAIEPGCGLLAGYGGRGITIERLRYHHWRPTVDTSLTLERATDIADELVERAVARQLESDVPLGAMLSGGIDSSLVSAAAQRGVGGDLLTFNVRPADESVDETEVAMAVAAHLGTRHRSVDAEPGAADWDTVHGFLRSLGQPLADPALFGVAAVSRAMRRHVTVALSGDGGDELFGGYHLFWKVGALARMKRFPAAAWSLAGFVLRPAGTLGLVGPTVPRQLSTLAGADDTALVQSLHAWIPDDEVQGMLVDGTGLVSTRRHFERTWQVDGLGSSRLERMSSLAVETSVRMLLGSKFLVKSDMGSMRESLELRVPLLDEDLADFGLALPHRLRVEGRTGKRVLREVAARHVPAEIARRPKQGFSNPIDAWMDDTFRRAMRETLLDDSSPLFDHLTRDSVTRIVLAFTERTDLPGMTRQSLHDRVLSLTALEACLRA